MRGKCTRGGYWLPPGNALPQGQRARAGGGWLRCFFVSDLHGRIRRYQKLFERIASERPQIVLLGGDLLPRMSYRQWVAPRPPDPPPTGAAPPARGGTPSGGEPADFLDDFLIPELRRLAGVLGSDYPRLLLILGNDDPRAEEAAFLREETRTLWTYLHDRRVEIGAFRFYGYACVPPTPFLLKDWERYDVSRFVDPGCVSPEEGRRSIPVPDRDIRHSTLADDLSNLAGEDDLSDAIFLFHSPPYQTTLDRAALDGKRVDHVPLDVHIGSIAIRRFIEERQPRITLHGHAHESARLTGAWRDRIGRTHLFSAAHDGPELALVRFNADEPERATRELV